MSAFLGVDVAKESLDVTLWDEKERKRRKHLANKPAGFEQLDAWLQRHTEGEVHVCMESTSVYWEELAEYLHQAGYQVSVVNPARIRGYAMSQMRRSKTDPLDGDVIVDFCRSQRPSLWTPPTAEQRQLRALVRHRVALQKSRTQQLNRLATSRDPEVKASLQRLIATLEAEIEGIEARLETFFDEHPPLKAKRDLLTSIPGIGEKTATHILAEMYDLDQYENAKAVAADAGITPSHYRSGTSVRRRSKMSRMGKAAIRGTLHFPAITAIQHNPVVRQLARRLEARGKPPGVIRVAAMRKLMHLAFGVLRHQQPFDPAYAAS